MLTFSWLPIAYSAPAHWPFYTRFLINPNLNNSQLHQTFYTWQLSCGEKQYITVNYTNAILFFTPNPLLCFDALQRFEVIT